MKKLILGLLFLVVSASIFAQTTNDVLNLLIRNKTITQQEADSIRAEAAIKQQDLDANKKSFLTSASRPVQFSGYTQIRYQFPEQSGKIDGFDIRRARFDVRGNISPYFGYRLQADFAGTPKLLDAYMEIKVFDYLNLTIGEAKIPFSFENLISSSKRELIDRSQVVEALVARGTDVIGNQNGRDIGVQLGGSLLKYKNNYLFDYKIGLFNGSGINTADKNKNKDIAGRFIAHPMKGLDFGGSFYSGVGNFGTPTATNQDRNRLGFEATYEYQRFFTRGEYIQGKDGAIKRNGWYAEAGYFIVPSRFEMVLRYDWYDPNAAISKNATTAYVIGAVYQFNNWARIQASFTMNKEEGAEIKNNLGAILFQISF